MKSGKFCEMIGLSVRNKVLEYFIEAKDLDFGFGDVAKEINVCRTSCWTAFKELLKIGYIKKTRKLCNKQLYTLNKDNDNVKLLMDLFNTKLK